MRPDDGGPTRANNFGSLRLLFAALVVLSHAPELIDGDRSREVLTQVFGTLSFGELAVDGFFLVSGYLITRSFRGTRSFAAYLAKRVIRIYPGFLVASLLCVLLVAPLAGGDLGAVSPLVVLGRAALLVLPEVPGAFAGLPHPGLNGAMWTIPCEFLCYLLIAGLHPLGMFRHRARYGALLAGLGLALVLRRLLLPDGEGGSDLWILTQAIRLPFLFLCGGGFYLFRDAIVPTGRGAALAAALLLPSMFSRVLAEPALALLGGYLVVWFALRVPPNRVSLATNRVDPSYGLYLSAWPLQSLLAAAWPGASLWLLAAITLAAATLYGIASWLLVERPAMRLRDPLAQAFRRIARRPRRAVAPAAL